MSSAVHSAAVLAVMEPMYAEGFLDLMTDPELSEVMKVRSLLHMCRYWHASPGASLGQSGQVLQSHPMAQLFPG